MYIISSSQGTVKNAFFFFCKSVEANEYVHVRVKKLTRENGKREKKDDDGVPQYVYFTGKNRSNVHLYDVLINTGLKKLRF